MKTITHSKRYALLVVLLSTVSSATQMFAPPPPPVKAPPARLLAGAGATTTPTTVPAWKQLQSKKDDINDKFIAPLSNALNASFNHVEAYKKGLKETTIVHVLPKAKDLVEGFENVANKAMNAAYGVNKYITAQLPAQQTALRQYWKQQKELLINRINERAEEISAALVNSQPDIQRLLRPTKDKTGKTASKGPEKDYSINLTVPQQDINLLTALITQTPQRIKKLAANAIEHLQE